MSRALYVATEALRFWNENEIELRELMIQRFSGVVRRTLLEINPAWKIDRVEGPILTPQSYVDAAYGFDDIFMTQVEKGSETLVLRPETTPSSYRVAMDQLSARGDTQVIKKKLPHCFWQVGKSFRVEKSDGATAAKMRYHEFYQQEFQCIYAVGTLADYRARLMEALVVEVERFTGRPVRIIESDRIPNYAESTLDIEVDITEDPIEDSGIEATFRKTFNIGSTKTRVWREVASCSIRKDFTDETRVAEIALGLDRLVDICTQN